MIVVIFVRGFFNDNKIVSTRPRASWSDALDEGCILTSADKHSDGERVSRPGQHETYSGEAARNLAARSPGPGDTNLHLPNGSDRSSTDMCFIDAYRKLVLVCNRPQHSINI